MEQGGKLINWNDAKGFGFIQPDDGSDRVFAHISVMRGDALGALVEDYAGKLNALAPLSLASLKRVLNATYDTSLKVAMELEGQAYEKLRGTEDYMEGIIAFAEKRKADYKGK